ncbi:hypothetical protein AMAG_19253 [Allomyces macrogynus ATCC 38327]|uniref:Plastocyanin-like domain-containing protein n=1 Tax=Allomyces macrogynus (strain ATCC 38327) TaxID=578462 RepID=A0A0L0SQF8_ALLM3|nr:hypothetical protein AMAG_19253 [Allomyces macrogynus ATCC 38327]|eukprot:KNE64609.1 hypothetical protein AMAG_19253 [Allomyces macrogynus ATCC 38327]
MSARARSTFPARRLAAALCLLAAVVALAARTATAADVIPCPDDARACLLRTYYVAAKEHAQPNLGIDAYPIDKEVFQMYLVLVENKSAYLAENVAKPTRPSTSRVLRRPRDFNESNKMHSINGLFWGNLPGLNFTVGERVRWFLLGFGTEVDIHTVHWHGMTLTSEGQRRDVIDLLPASFRVADMVPDTEGNWLLHCHVGDHFMAGMIAFMNIVEKGAEGAKSAAGRAVVEVASVVTAAAAAMLAAWV